MRTVKELNDLIFEWKELRKLAKSELILYQIDLHIDTLKTQLNRLETQTTPQKTEENHKNENSLNKNDFIPIQNFAWDQETDQVNVYITLKDIQNISNENIQVNFTANSFDLKIYNLKEKNYRMHVAKLCSNILPEKCLFKVRKDIISIKLKKDLANKGQRHWEQLHYKENIKPKPTKSAESEDPAASLMDLMKNLYQDGDDEMKRTIAKAWTEAQDKKYKSNNLFGADPQFSDY